MATATEVIPATCPRDCYDSCGAADRVCDGGIAQVPGDPLYPMSCGALCNKCSAGYNDELLAPSVRARGPARFANGAKGGHTMDRRALPRLLKPFLTPASRRDILRVLAGTATAILFGVRGVGAKASANRAGAATDAFAVRPLKPSDYCWNTTEAVGGPVATPTPFLYQPFSGAVDWSSDWTAQMDHAKPTYRTDRDGAMATLGEPLTHANPRPGLLQGGTRATTAGRSYRFYDASTPLSDITEAIRAYESPSRETYVFYEGHDGHDFAVTGRALAAAAGTVAFKGDYGDSLGRVVEVYHPEGYLTRYAHLASYAAGIDAGAEVAAGAALGDIGGSQIVVGDPVDPPDARAWGVHLHFSVFRWNDDRAEWQVTDPFGWDPWRGPGDQSDDPLVRCNGEVSHVLWVGWWPRPAEGEAAVAARPAGGSYVGGWWDAEEAVSSPPAEPTAPAYIATVLETVGEDPGSTAINAAGQVVGASSYVDGALGSSAVLWEDGHARVLVGLTEQTTQLGGSTAYDINDAGQIVGSSESRDGTRRPVIWEQGRLRELPSRGGDCFAVAINEAGLVAGWESRLDGTSRALLWENGQLRELPGLGGERSSVSSINNLGQVVGVSETPDGTQVAVLWENGDVCALPDLGGGSSAADINDAGQIVGQAKVTDGTKVAVLWENGGVRELVGLGGAPAEARAINNLGQIVGEVRMPDGNDLAVLWESGNVRTLRDLGWGSSATDINDAGLITGSVDFDEDTRNAVIWSRD